jgi:methylenetetrahydrofolate--tRNA-(uracil-5-)-methyltransferase
MDHNVVVIGGGLAGSESAWQLAERGIRVKLYEMRPHKTTGAHETSKLAELVCSNSLGSKLRDRATGLLQTESKLLGSKLMQIAEDVAVPAGGSLAVDREQFAERVTSLLEAHPLIEIIRQEVLTIPENQPTIVATGPLTSDRLAQDIKRLTGQGYLYFYDAVAPIIVAESIDMNLAFRASRYDRGDEDEGDYINCPMNRDEYSAFVQAIRNAA